MNWRNPLLSLAIAAALPMGAAHAGSTDALKVGLPGDHTDVLPTMRDSRLVTFRYSDDVSFAIRAMEGTFVNIEVPEGEMIQGFYLSDAVDWFTHITGDGRRVLVKPLAPGLINTGTLITNKRSYELTLVSVSPGQRWFQRVRWQVPSNDPGANGLYWRGQAVTGSAGSAGKGAPSIDPDKLHFDYDIRGREDFTPVSVFDDGTRTWFKFRDVQTLPAIFAVRDGDLEVVNFSVQGPYVVIPMLADEFVLRLRDDDVTVEREG